jgi:hypothetical protein
MPGTVSHVVKQFHHDSTHQLEPEAIRSACHDIDYQWRQRLLDPVVTIQLFLQGGVHAVFRVHQTHIVDCHQIVPMSATLKAGAKATREAALALVGKAWCVRSTRRVAGV